MCDRVFVFRDGRVVSELSGDDLTEDRIVQQCLVERGSAAA
jgi:ABC-type sugar transport system ATPase subunit